MIMALYFDHIDPCPFRLPSVGFLTLWFFFLLAPTSVMPLPDLAFEHRMYLPLAAIVVMTVGGAYRLLRFAAAHWCIAKRNENKMIFKGALYLLLLSAASLMILTFSRNLDYGD
ncbi:MAG: hypothetical protein MZV49_25660 [Rhodopseudomonas palustris]|nr:hypothetical protein [Rhodopseudomonas palustris]